MLLHKIILFGIKNLFLIKFEGNIFSTKLKIKSVKKSAITKPVLILSLVSLFTDIASEMLYPISPIFLTSVLGSSMVVVGIIEGIAESIAGISKGYFGFISDRIGKRKPFVILGYGLSAFLKSLPGVWTAVNGILTARVGDRIGKGIRTAPRDALLASYSTQENRGAVFGFHRGVDTLGAALGPALSLIFLFFFPGQYQMIFLLAFIPSVIAFTLAFFVKEKSFQPTKKDRSTLLISFSIWKDSPLAFKHLILIVTFFSFFNGSDVFLILRSRQIGFSDFIAIGGYIFYNLVYASASYPIGILSDKIGKRKTFSLGITIFSLTYIGFAFVNSDWFCWILFAFYGIYAASTEGIVKAWISNLIPQQKRASAIGIQNALSSIAFLFASVLTGLVWNYFGSSVAMMMTASAGLLTIILLLRSRSIKLS